MTAATQGAIVLHASAHPLNIETLRNMAIVSVEIMTLRNIAFGHSDGILRWWVSVAVDGQTMWLCCSAVFFSYFFLMHSLLQGRRASLCTLFTQLFP
jgi:hypothetical protein